MSIVSVEGKPGRYLMPGYVNSNGFIIIYNIQIMTDHHDDIIYSLT